MLDVSLRHSALADCDVGLDFVPQLAPICGIIDANEGIICSAADARVQTGPPRGVSGRARVKCAIIRRLPRQKRFAFACHRRRLAVAAGAAGGSRRLTSLCFSSQRGRRGCRGNDGVGWGSAAHRCGRRRMVLEVFENAMRFAWRSQGRVVGEVLIVIVIQYPCAPPAVATKPI